MSTDSEIVLPSGRFAKIRGLTGKDYLEAVKASREGQDMSFVMVTLAVTIDDKPVTYQDLQDMDLRDVMTIMPEITKFLSGPITS